MVTPGGDTVSCGGIVSYARETVNTFDGVIPYDIEGILVSDEHRLIVGGGFFGSG